MSIKERWAGFEQLPEGVRAAVADLPSFLEASGVQLAFLFGSLNRRQRAQDVDLGLLGGERPVFELRRPLVRRLGTERLDLVDLASASPVLRFEVLRPPGGWNEKQQERQKLDLGDRTHRKDDE